MCLKLRKRTVLCAILSAVILTSGVHTINKAVLASSPITETEALSQAVSLYESLTLSEVPVPDGLDGSSEILKSVVLGYINLEDTEDTAEKSVRKQDFISILYKTIISYNESYTIYEDEADAILNKCYDNAYIDEKNRIPYAFMMKQGIITAKFGSEPNKELTREECETLITTVYDMFAQNVTMTVNEAGITIGANINTVLDAFGAPNRIDETEYGFEWYTYNSDYASYFMVGVEADRICAFFSNSSAFDLNGINAGDDFALTADYTDKRCFRLYHTPDGKVDAVLYNPRFRDGADTASIKRSKSMILLDMINANRVKNWRPIYVEDSELSSQAWLGTLDVMGDRGYGDSMLTQSGFDVFSVYRQLVEDENEILTQPALYPSAVGISTASDMSGGIHTSIISDTDKAAVIDERETVELPEPDYTVSGVDEVTEPVLLLPETETEYNAGDDVVIQLAEQTSAEYHIEMFDVENDEYAVNEYVVTDETEITLPAELFKDGRDYRLIVSAVTEFGEALSAEEVLVSYGSAYDGGVEIVTPYANGILDGDTIEISWKSDRYHDFYVDLYCDNTLVASKVVEDSYEAVIQGAGTGKCFLYVTALRRGTRVEKAQDCVAFEVQQPAPVINEIILDRDDKYYFVYEDEDLGLLYFYDEELVDVDEDGETVTKKKIIQKQVKATAGYKKLARWRSKPEYTTGDPTVTERNIYYDGTKGSAIVAEAEKYLGTPYVWGGTTPSGFDCSGLVQYVMNTLGINVSRVAEDQFRNGTPVNRDELRAGDLVFFEQNGYIHHVGIYAGNNMMIHAPRTGDVVRYQSIDTDYYRSEYAGARRVY